MSNEETIPSRSQKKSEATAGAAPTPPKSLAGRYRVRDGYTLGYGELDAQGRHPVAAGGEVVELTHEEALSAIRLTKDQKNADGSTNGPAIETEAAYNARITAKAEHEKFMKQLEESNNGVNF